MTRFTKTASGRYVVKGKSYEMLMGSRAQVWHGTAYKTSGGLTKYHLMQNKSGRIVSREKHNTAKKEKRLVKAGYGTKKGKFGFVLLNKTGKHRGRRHSRSHRRHRGGSGTNLPLSPSSYDGKGVGTSGVNLQFVASNAA